MISICMYRDCNLPLTKSGEHLPYTDMPVPSDKYVSHGICLDCMPKCLREGGMSEDEIKTFMEGRNEQHNGKVQKTMA